MKLGIFFRKERCSEHRLWGKFASSFTFERTNEGVLFIAIGAHFMSTSWITNALPFWILGVPLVVAVISYMRMPKQSELAPPDRREERHNIVREPAIRAGDTAVSRG